MDEGRLAREDSAEPAFNAPWPPLALAVALVALYAVQGTWNGLDHALIPAEAVAGRWAGLFTSLFIHLNWPHVLLNAVGLLAFGAAVARLLGSGPRGAAVFAGFYVVCGLAGSVAYILLHAQQLEGVVGASGAVAGLMGAASRLIQRGGRLSPLARPPVIGMGLAWLAVNAVAALFGTLPGAGGASIAWEAHLAGYAAGLLLIAPAAALAGRLAR